MVQALVLVVIRKSQEIKLYGEYAAVMLEADSGDTAGGGRGCC